MEQEKEGRWLPRDTTQIIPKEQLDKKQRTHSETARAMKDYFEDFPEMHADLRYEEHMKKQYPEAKARLTAIRNELSGLHDHYETYQKLISYTAKRNILPPFSELIQVKDRQLTELVKTLESLVPTLGGRFGARLEVIALRGETMQNAIDNLVVSEETPTVSPAEEEQRKAG